MNNHRYILDKGSKKFNCPDCNQKRFVRYIDNETKEYLPDDIGRCDRQSSCGCWNKPVIEITEKRTGKHIHKPNTAPKPVSFIEPGLLKASLKHYEGNHFVQYLISLFGNDVAGQLVGKYFIGTSNHWQGANIFWQIDTDKKIRTGKIMLYSPATGKRVKEPCNHIAWVHTAIKQPDFEVSQCLFGSHLLKDKTKAVALCESEKTAIIASVYFPKFIWVATGGADGLSSAKCESLNRHGKPVVLFPDISAPKDGKQSTFEKWQTIACKHLLKYKFSTLLESRASESDKSKGLDLADYLIQFDCRKFTAAAQPVNKPLGSSLKYEIEGNVTYLSEIKTAFEGMVIVKIATDTGKQYNVLYSSKEDAPPIRLQTDAVNQLASHYNIKFIPATHEGVECLASIVKPKEAVIKAKCYSIEQLKSLALSHFNKYPMFKDKPAALPNYFAAWVKDMSEIIKTAGTTEQELLKILVND